VRRPIKSYKLRVNGCFGFENPATTGSIYGYLNGLKVLNNKKLQLDLKPDFQAPGLNGHLALYLRFHLGYLTFLALAFAVRVGFRWLSIRLSTWKFRPA
jgi:hypothetical protein